MFCPECGCENEDNAKFCCQCGTALVDEEDAEQQEENDEGRSIVRFSVVIFIVIVAVFVYLCFQSCNRTERQELYTFYITDSAGEELMSGGIENAEVAKTKDTEMGTEIYRVNIELTDDAAEVLGYITERKMGK